MSPRTSAPWSDRSTSLARAQLLSTVSASSSLASSPGRARNGECAPGISVRSTPRRGFVTARLKLDGDRGVVDSSDGRAGSVRQLGHRVGTIPEAARVLRPQPLEGPGRILRVAVGVEGDPCGLERPENARPVTQGDGLVGLRPTHGRRIIPRPTHSPSRSRLDLHTGNFTLAAASQPGSRLRHGSQTQLE